MIEATRDFTSEFDMRHLIFSDRHRIRPIHQDVRGLQQGISEKPVRMQIAASELVDLFLVGRHPFEPAQRRDHRQQKVKFGMFHTCDWTKIVERFGSSPLASQSRALSRMVARISPVDS